MQFRRYGIYYTPEPGALADFGAQWLGWDPVAGKHCPHAEIADLPRPVEEITAMPRKYGLHGTIKPPFFLADGHSPEALQKALAGLCATLPPVTLPSLTLSRLGSFLALKIDGDQTPLAALAARAVIELDRFRRPPSEAELARRRQANLSPQQEALLAQWGYPYVMEEFRFHITLTGRLGKDAEQTQAALQPHIAPLLPQPFVVGSLTLMGEDDNQMFHEIQRYALTG
ncbi:DUF1045 domain-containing protein [Shimia sp. R11_0]|uniref:DUF1045 domain-containing protein n=1 Tax=Shimia sp. R11_0 TaxID=2821096 RepID=UPI001ADC76A1|nr:DUF1045 domain-containing protein [Shimia sp. R11_0]MBO9478535.1 DUF1045 domain-containing protein [Shimia sp. R11_0]